MPEGIAEALLKRDRIIVLAGLAIIIVLAWVYTIYLAHDMGEMDMGMGMGMRMGMDMPMDMNMKMSMPNMHTWGFLDFLLLFIMWVVMMVAMMTPSAAPMVLVFSKINRQRYNQQNPYLATAIFLLGYLIVWIGFSAVATLTQWSLHSVALLSPMMVSTSPILGGVLLISAGIFQFTPLKYTCLSHCRSPMGFLMTEWRKGNRGALIMGLRHGSFCVGCCWLIMALLFVAGVMNLLWVAIIAIYVLIEKVVPAGHWVSRIIGILVIIWGLWTIAGTLF